MTWRKIHRWGLIASFTVLLVSAGAFLWPLLATPRFWLSAGFVVGIVGTFLFTVALTRFDTNKTPIEEE